jgi:ADP-heptose:LPS heptosyltransferase
VPENKILVIRGGAIGDFILTLPVLAALRAQFSKTHMEVLGYPHIAQLAVAGGMADACRPIESRALAGFFARNGELDGEWKNYFASFAIILSFLYDPDGIFQDNISRSSPARFIAGPHRPDENAGIHATEVFLKILEPLAIFGADPVPRLPLKPAPSSLKPLALHPGSGGERKNWPEAGWKELLSRLMRETTRPLLLVGGEAEGDRIERLAQGIPGDHCEILSRQPLVDVARRLADCAAFVGHDSGISHLAAAVGLPGIAIWGASNATVWRPRSNRFNLVEAPSDMASLSVETVLSAVSGLSIKPSA